MFLKNIVVGLLFQFFCHSKNLPCVRSRFGNIRGHYKLSSNGYKYEAYEGIPYAMPPTGHRRYLPPEPIRHWQGEIEATEFPQMCIGHNRAPDANGDYVSGVEDCLYLNVYAPIKKSSKSLPVIIYIYGGAFQYGSLTGMDEQYLIDYDVIFVSFNYRHGSLGFLSTEDDVVSGNMGLKDQAMALKWVSENIKHFGGDPEKITLTGLSAGAASVHFHYLSKMSAGLFRSGISFSGTALDPWAMAEDSRKKAIRLGKLLNCSSDNVAEMVDCLRKRSAHDITAAQSHFMPWHLNEFSPFGPVVEKHSKYPFIDRSPIDIINSGDAYDAPWVTGVVSEEGLYPVAEFVTNKTAFDDLDRNWDTIAPQLLNFYYTIPEKNQSSVAQRIRKHYFGDRPITRENLHDLVRLNSDRNFIVNAEKAARAQAKVNESPVWFYYYTHRAANSFSDSMSLTTENYGVSHVDDVFLVLGNSVINPKKTANDYFMRQELTKFWISVAFKGVPKFGPKWAPIDPKESKLNYLHMAGPFNFTEESNDNFRDKKFWETIDFNENK